MARKGSFEHKSNKGEEPVKFSRRTMLGAAVGFPLIVPRHVLGGVNHQAPSDMLRIAAVGVGGMGRNFLQGCGHERVTALCDLDHGRCGDVFAAFPEASRYHDFREMFDKEAENFDALIVATPDHTHTWVLMHALELGGKHIYCAKPVTRNIADSRRVKAAFEKNSHLVTMTSVQSSGTEGARATTEILQSGVLGPIRELHIWISHPACPCDLLRPSEVQTPPPGMDWDAWIGPAPYRPYHSMYHPETWRTWWDFGNGTVGDVACHTMHICFKELQLGAPARVYGNGSTYLKGFFDRVETPETQSRANMVTWEYPARGDLPPLSMHWYDGGMRPHRPRELDPRIPLERDGLLFVGDEGKLLAGFFGGNPYQVNRPKQGIEAQGIDGGLLLPAEKFKDFEQPPKALPRVKDHYAEWTEACKSGGRTTCPLEFGCEMTEVAQLGTLALRTERLLEWDAANMRITNDEEANSMLDPAPREGWELP